MFQALLYLVKNEKCWSFWPGYLFDPLYKSIKENNPTNGKHIIHKDFISVSKYLKTGNNLKEPRREMVKYFMGY